VDYYQVCYWYYADVFFHFIKEGMLLLNLTTETLPSSPVTLAMVVVMVFLLLVIVVDCSSVEC
jgi:hypothetical protein